MLNPYILFENILTDIENGLKDDVNTETLAQKYKLSARHLERLFKFSFEKNIGSYIRSRKLASSIDDLLQTNNNILDIALDYSFEYEQSFIRSFKREFGLTPGDFRKTGKILKITPPFQLIETQKIPYGVLFGPEIVVVPKFHVIGIQSKMPFRDVLIQAPLMHERFMVEYKKAKNNIKSSELLSVARNAGKDVDYFYFMSAVQVKTLDHVPQGFDSYTFETSVCARFRFIAHNPDDVLNMHSADRMFQAIDDFMDDKDQHYFLERKRVNFDRYNSMGYTGGYYQWEWFAPVIKKTPENASPVHPIGIIKTYKQTLPALRFIGKKYAIKDSDELVKNNLNILGECQLNGSFEIIEKQSKIDLKTLCEGGNAYINLIKYNANKSVECWIGMFMPPETKVPESFQMIDFPKTKIGVCQVYGKKSQIINYEIDCRKRLKDDGFSLDNYSGTRWYFQRINWHKYFEEDKFGNRILEYCFIIK